MQRNLELVRDILMDAEAAEAGKNIYGFEYPDRSQNEVLCHVELLIEAGLIDGNVFQDEQGQACDCVVKKITWNGHEFLANAKNDTV